MLDLLVELDKHAVNTKERNTKVCGFDSSSRMIVFVNVDKLDRY